VCAYGRATTADVAFWRDVARMGASLAEKCFDVALFATSFLQIFELKWTKW
jgi:hypothetical protein